MSESKQTKYELRRFFVQEPAIQRANSLKIHEIDASVRAAKTEGGMPVYLLEVPQNQAHKAEGLLEELFAKKEKDRSRYQEMEEAHKEKGRRNILIGIVILAACIGLYFTQWYGEGGLFRIFFYGAILTGVFQIIRGRLQLR